MKSCPPSKNFFGRKLNSYCLRVSTLYCSCVTCIVFVPPSPCSVALFLLASNSFLIFSVSCFLNTRFWENGLITTPANSDFPFAAMWFTRIYGILRIAGLFGSFGICATDVYTGMNFSCWFEVIVSGYGLFSSFTIAGTNSLQPMITSISFLSFSFVRSSIYSFRTFSSSSLCTSRALFLSSTCCMPP